MARTRHGERSCKAEGARRRIEQFNTLADSSGSLTAGEHNATVRQQRGGVARSGFYKRCWYRGPRIRGRLIDFGGAEKFAARRDAASYKNAAVCQVDRSGFRTGDGHSRRRCD